MLAVGVLVVGTASLYCVRRSLGDGRGRCGIPSIQAIVSNITAGDGAGLSGVRGMDVFAADAGLYMVAAASDGGAIL